MELAVSKGETLLALRFSVSIASTPKRPRPLMSQVPAEVRHLQQIMDLLQQISSRIPVATKASSSKQMVVTEASRTGKFMVCVKMSGSGSKVSQAVSFKEKKFLFGSLKFSEKSFENNFLVTNASSGLKPRTLLYANEIAWAKDSNFLFLSRIVTVWNLEGTTRQTYLSVLSLLA